MCPVFLFQESQCGGELGQLSKYSEMLLLGGVPAHTLITPPHTHRNRRRGRTRRLCDSIGSDGKVILLSDDELALARRGRTHFHCV